MSFSRKAATGRPTFYWYDLETFGLETRSDRIAQFAGVRTDTDLNILGEPDEFFCQPVFDYLPNPESSLLTGITPDQCEAKGLREAEFANAIHEQFSQPGTCVTGYNNIRFDDEFIRFLFYRNLHDAYAWHWQNGNSRWDILDVVRATYALRPEGIQWPRHEDGKPSFKLEDLTQANNLMHEAAHDAVSDVLATIALARLIKEKQPRLFDFFLKLRDKREAAKLLDYRQMRPVVHVSGMIPAERGCLTVMLPLMPMPGNSNAVIAYDLAHDPGDLLTLDAEAIQERVFTRQDELPEGYQRVPLKAIHSNKSPVLAPLSVLTRVVFLRIRTSFCWKNCARTPPGAYSSRRLSTTRSGMNWSGVIAPATGLRHSMEKKPNAGLAKALPACRPVTARASSSGRNSLSNCDKSTLIPTSRPCWSALASGLNASVPDWSWTISLLMTQTGMTHCTCRAGNKQQARLRNIPRHFCFLNWRRQSVRSFDH